MIEKQTQQQHTGQDSPDTAASKAALGSRIVVVAHAPLASALSAVVAHVHGAVPACFIAVDVTPDQTPDSVARLLAQAINNATGKPTEQAPALILTDLPGATPHNGAVRCLQANAESRLSESCLISPLTVPMVLRAINYSHQAPAQLAQTLQP